jgi:hypothetical protein
LLLAKSAKNAQLTKKKTGIPTGLDLLTLFRRLGRKWRKQDLERF